MAKPTAPGKGCGGVDADLGIDRTITSHNATAAAALQPITEAGGPLQASEQTALENYEADIAHGLKTFITVGNALAAIRDGRLYRAEHGTFEAYCDQRWQIRRQRAYALIDAATTVREMSEISDTPIIVESHAAALARLPVEEREAAWSDAQETAQAEGRGVTAADVSRGKSKSEPTLSAESDEWYSPADLMAAAREVLGAIDLDPASCEAANLTVKADQYFTQDDDGLAQEWHGRVWCNPPYSLAGKFADKALADYDAGRIEACVLNLSAPAATTLWFAPLLDRLVCFSTGRIKYISGGEAAGDRPTTGSAWIYVGPHPERFCEVFSRFGKVMQPATGGAFDRSVRIDQPDELGADWQEVVETAPSDDSEERHFCNLLAAWRRASGAVTDRFREAIIPTGPGDADKPGIIARLVDQVRITAAERGFDSPQQWVETRLAEKDAAARAAKGGAS
jgi:phage N-6-adenine-methyltransferase